MYLNETSFSPLIPPRAIHEPLSTPPAPDPDISPQTAELCPEPASLLAPCVCGKNQNSERASETINSSVDWSCSNDQDITSAQDFLAAYCAMTAGTTSFPEPSMAAGDSMQTPLLLLAGPLAWIWGC